jgi:hypothetical protein
MLSDLFNFNLLYLDPVIKMVIKTNNKIITNSRNNIKAEQRIKKHRNFCCSYRPYQRISRQHQSGALFVIKPVEGVREMERKRTW